MTIERLETLIRMLVQSTNDIPSGRSRKVDGMGGCSESQPQSLTEQNVQQLVKFVAATVSFETVLTN